LPCFAFVPPCLRFRGGTTVAVKITPTHAVTLSNVTGYFMANKASTEVTTLKVAALKSSVFITVLAGMTRAAVTARPSGPSKVPRPRMNQPLEPFFARGHKR